jgi:putative PIN family toxin of toxin-antitoxin system
VIRVTADTNILVSGLNFSGGKPFAFLELAREGKISLAVSDAILDEMADVLVRKFDFSPERVGRARSFITGMARVVMPAVRLDVVKDDPDDNKVLECASAAGSDFIVTGDKDLLRLGRYDAIRIMTVADFLKQGIGRERKL